MANLTEAINALIEDKIAAVKAEYEAKIAELEAKIKKSDLTQMDLYNIELQDILKDKRSTCRDNKLYDLYVKVYKYLHNTGFQFNISTYDKRVPLLTDIYGAITDSCDTIDERVSKMLAESGFRLVDLTPIAIIPQKSLEPSDEYIVRLLKHNNIALLNMQWVSHSENIRYTFKSMIFNESVDVNAAHRLLGYVNS